MGEQGECPTTTGSSWARAQRVLLPALHERQVRRVNHPRDIISVHFLFYRFSSFKPFSQPEILRVPLEELCLHILVCHNVSPTCCRSAFLDVGLCEPAFAFFRLQKCSMGQPGNVVPRLLDPPQLSAISRAMTILREVGATRLSADVTLANEVVLTPLGFHLAALPLNVRIAKMLVYAAVFGCLYPAVSMEAPKYLSLT